MFRFQPDAPLDTTTFTPASVDDRTGPPLTQGLLFTLFATVASDRFTPEELAMLSAIDPNAWYHGQLLESLLARLEARDSSSPYSLGRSTYVMLRGELMKSGLMTATQALTAIPFIWKNVTRGDCGEWRVSMTGPLRAHMDLEQPHNCS